MASRAVCKSAIIAVVTALRLSGRFSVIVAIASRHSRRSVEYMVENTSSIQKWRMGVLNPNFVGHGKNLGQALGFDSGISACFFQRRENLFGGEVADQIVSGKWTAPESSKRAVKAAASRFVRRHNFLFRIFWP